MRNCRRKLRSSHCIPCGIVGSHVRPVTATRKSNSKHKQMRHSAENDCRHCMVQVVITVCLRRVTQSQQQVFICRRCLAAATSGCLRELQDKRGRPLFEGKGNEAQNQGQRRSPGDGFQKPLVDLLTHQHRSSLRGLAQRFASDNRFQKIICESLRYVPSIVRSHPERKRRAVARVHPNCLATI